MRTLWCWGLMTLLLCLSGAQGFDVKRDSRLSQRVSLRIAATPLHHLLRELERQTGVALRVESSLREYRAFARLQNRPLHDALRRIAEAFGFEWRAEPASEGKDAPLRYVLYLPEAERRREVEQRALLPTDTINLVREAIRLIPSHLLEHRFEEFSAQMGLTLPTGTGFPYAEGVFLPQARLPEPTDTQGLQAKAVAAARARMLESAARTPKDLLTLRMLATLTDAEWRALRTEGCLSLSPERLPRAWLEQWTRDYIRLSGYAEEDIAQYQPLPTVPNVIYTAIDPRPELKVMLQGDYQIACFYDSRTMQFMAHCVVQTADSVRFSFGIELDGAAILETAAALEDSRRSETPDWLAQTPNKSIQRIAEKAWAEAISARWVDWLSYHIVEGLESAGVEGVGEFYPLITGEVIGMTHWRELLQQLLQIYVIEPREGVWLFQARARYFGRVIDAPAFRLHALTAAPVPTLDELSAIAHQLSQRQIAALEGARRRYLAHYQSEESLKNAYFMDAWEDTLRTIAQSKRYYYALQWYAMLNATQRAALQHGQPIPYTAMTPPQRALFLAAIQTNQFVCLQEEPVDEENAYARVIVERTTEQAHLALENRTETITRQSYRIDFFSDRASRHIFEFVYLLPKE